MKSLLFRMLCFCVVAASLLVTGCGGGGGGDDLLPGGQNNPGTNEGLTSGNGVATGFVSNAAISRSIRGSLLKSVSTPAAGMTVEAGDYDDRGVFVPFGQRATTDATGYYRIEGLPTGRRNIVLRATLGGTVLEGVLPEILEGKIASAPVIDPNSIYQAKLVRFAEDFDATFEVNLGEILSIIPIEKLPTLGELELARIAQAFVNREKAQLQMFRQAGLEDAKFVEFREFAFSLQREICEGIAQGLYCEAEGWQLFGDQLRLRARSLGLPPDVLLGLQDADDKLIGETLPGIVNAPEVTQHLEAQTLAGKLEGVIAALKVMTTMTPPALPMADYQLISDSLERLMTALKAAPSADAVRAMFQADPVHGLIQAAFKTTFMNLGLFEGTPPLITRLYPAPRETQRINTSSGFDTGLGELTLAASVRKQTVSPLPPTPDQLTIYHDAIRDLIIGKILANVPAIANSANAKDLAAALFVLLMQGPEMGFTYIPAEIPQDPTGDLPGRIMGIIEECNGHLYIKPPEGFPEGPASFSGYIAMVADGSLVGGQPVTATTTPHVYIGYYTAKPDVMNSMPATFRITGYADDVVTIPELEPMTFTGGPLERDAAGEFWFGLTQRIRTRFLPESEAVRNAMQNMLGMAVTMEGLIIEKRPAPDYGPAVVKVFAIRPASDTGFVPPGIEIPGEPAEGAAIANQSGLWSFDRSSPDPRNMFKFTWRDAAGMKSAYVIFDPNALTKVPAFRFQNPTSGRDLWESDGHTVTISGKLFTDETGAQRLFMTTFEDSSTIWPNPEVPFTPPEEPASGTLITDLSGILSVDPKSTDPATTFKLLWTRETVRYSAYVTFDPATLEKSPKFRYQDPVGGHDMWESAGHTVTVSGLLSPDGTRLFLTKFSDASTVWPQPGSVLPPASIR
ncbi:MAG TPA: carboxypeptidase-like regulatory domain-containing protein [Candidatus Ozemobacteraceae bacterium]